MGLVDFLRQKSFRRELQKAERKKDKLKKKAKRLVELDEMKKRLEKARGQVGLTKAEREALKKRIDKIESIKKDVKKEFKTALKTITRSLKETSVDFLVKADKAFSDEPKRRRKRVKKKAKKRQKRKTKRRKK